MTTCIGHGLMPSKTRLGQFTRNRRLELGLSQNRLAELAGISQAEISRAERGNKKNSKPRKSTLKNLAKALGCELARLENMAPKKPAGRPKTELGRLIQSRLQTLGLTPGDLQKKLGVADNCIPNWIAGRSLSISYKLLRPLAGALKLELADLSEFALKRNKPAETAFGRMVRRRRQERGWSASVLAGKVGITRAGVSCIERKGICSKKLAKKLAEKLGLDPAALLALKPARKKRVRRVKSSA